jgi:hypothetical protein
LSDLDLDVVVADGVLVDPTDEVRRLEVAFERLGEHIALVVPRRPDEAKVVLASLMQLSVRFHPLRTTSPNIRSGLLVLCGSLAQAEIEAAADANARATMPTPTVTLQSICICDIVGAESALARDQLWLALDILHQLRARLMATFCQAYGFGERPIRSFARRAPPTTQELLASTQATAVTDAGLRQALQHALDLLEYHLPCFAGPGARLSRQQQIVVTALRARLVE